MGNATPSGRADEVARHALAEIFRGAIHLGVGNPAIIALATMGGYTHVVPTAVHLGNYGIAVPANEYYHVIHIDINWPVGGAALHNMLQECVACMCLRCRCDAAMPPQSHRDAD